MAQLFVSVFRKMAHLYISVYKVEWNKTLFDSLKANEYEKVILPEHDNLVHTLSSIQFMMVGQMDRMFCNSFLTEMIQLLTNAVCLYEDGYFDAAFYSIRQAAEVSNNMLYIASAGKEELGVWDRKEYFPMNSAITKRIKEMNDFYLEIHDEAIPEFFDEQDKLIKKCHKIIHKQGFDTFYHYRRTVQSFSKEDENKLFVAALKHTIAVAIILYIITDPISLVLADDELSSHFNFDPMCEPADVRFIEEEFSSEIITKIKNTEWFTNYSELFLKQEKMMPEVEDVIRCQHFDLMHLDVINKQAHLLGLNERIILSILVRGIQITHIYPDCFMLGYSTTIHSNHRPTGLCSEEFDSYLNVDEQFNIPYHNIFRSVFLGLDQNWLFEHNDPLTPDDLSCIKDILTSYREEYTKLNNTLGCFGLR